MIADKVRATVLTRSDGLCEVCGRAEGVDLHHRRPRAMGGSTRIDTNTPQNLLHLCRGCHDEIERNRTNAYLLGRLLRQTDPLDQPVHLWHGVVTLTVEGQAKKL